MGYEYESQTVDNYFCAKQEHYIISGSVYTYNLWTTAGWSIVLGQLIFMLMLITCQD